MAATAYLKYPEGVPSSGDDVEHYVIIRKFPDSVFSIRWEANHHIGNLSENLLP
jgi:hypothetical protein